MHNLITSIFGRKGTGKSTLAFELCEERDRVFFFDTMGEAGARPGWTKVFGRDECIRAMLAASRERHFRLALQCASTDEYLDLASMAYEVPDQLTVIEEASFFCSPSMLPDQLSVIVRMGRHRKIDQLYVARRPSEIHRDLTANSDLVVAFQTHEPRDVLYLRAIGGPDAERVRALPPFRVLAWGDLERAPVAVISRLDNGAGKVQASEVSEQEPPAT